MKIITNKNKLIKLIEKKKNLGFVPTMGAIHDGHISLIKKSILQSNKTIVSIFINKPQFNRKIDFNSYPRNLKKDVLILKKLKIDYLFIPSSKDIYPKGVNKNIKIDAFGKQLCGINRPNHFEAIADVIDKFIKIIKPAKIFLGEKDMQQLKIIQHFVHKKYKKIKIVGCKTFREKNGIAYSSRNFLLTQNQKNIASRVYHLIYYSKKRLLENKISIKVIKYIVNSLGVDKIDYIKIVDLNKTTKPFKKNSIYKIFIAYYLGSIRLIDNI